MKKSKFAKKMVLGMLIFIAGILFGSIANSVGSVNFNLNSEKPLSNSIIISSKNTEAPSNVLNISDIEVQNDKIILNIAGARISSYASTGSMLPVLNENANGIEIVPQNAEQIHVGDIITYQDEAGDLVVHRVAKIGNDNEGIYFITKGDNSALNDGKIRFEQIKYLTIAIVY